jgi:exodeoxyribonuclease V alpha subunit
MSRTEELTGIFSYEKHVFQESSPDRTVIAEVSANGSGVITVKGKALRGQLEYGMTYRFLGVWHVHDKYGKQFHFNSFCVAEPAGEVGIAKYLAKAPHIGRARARALWDYYGADAVRMLRENPDAVSAQVKGLTPEKAAEAAKWLILNKKLEAVTIELMNLLGNRHFPRDIVSRCIGRWGEQAAETIRDNPYSLMEFSGVGFLKADALYKELGKPMDSLMRQALCGWYALASDTEGSTWFPLRLFTQAISQNVSGVNVDPDAALAWADANELIRIRQDRGAWVADARKADNESALATHLRRAMDEILDPLGLPDASLLRWPMVDELDDAADEFKLSDEQRREAAKAMSGRVGLLLGSPGCGKTFVLARITRAIQRRGGSFSVCAPTGKAASRITESLARAGVAATARTIHSTLIVKANEEGGGGWNFEHGAGNPLPVDYLFVDESSMIDVDIAAHLLAARRKGCHLLFVGDPNQLAPVGHGAPLRDMIAAGVTCGQLRTVQRNAGRIVKACAEIRDRHRFEAGQKIDLVADDPENLYVDSCKPERQAEVIKNWLAAVRDGRDVIQGEAKDWIWDVQVLCPLNDSGAVSRQALNKELQPFLNPTGKQFPGCPFRIADKIICKKNSRLPAAPGCPQSERDDEGKVYVANGEQARVMEIEPSRIVVQLDTPRRLVIIPRGKPKEGDGKDGEGKSDDGAIGDWELGYAISVHKSQGSEWPICIVVIDESGGAKWVCKREWTTTAISRAKVLCVCVGRASTMSDFCRKSGLWDRRTFLVNKVRELSRLSRG